MPRLAMPPSATRLRSRYGYSTPQAVFRSDDSLGIFWLITGRKGLWWRCEKRHVTLATVYVEMLSRYDLMALAVNVDISPPGTLLQFFGSSPVVVGG